MRGHKIVSLVMAVMTALGNAPLSYAQGKPWMPEPGTRVETSPSFAPPFLKGMTIHPKDPFHIDFLISHGDMVLSRDEKSREYRRLIKYFLAAMAIDDTRQWVNLSPYEKDRIIPDDFGQTEMGRDLLAQDYLLKQITSSLLNPDHDLGRVFWTRVYREARERFGSADVPADAFNKVWIMPDRAVIYEKGGTAYVLENRLKVMLEVDYLAAEKQGAGSGELGIENNGHSMLHAPGSMPAQELTKQILREVIVPALEKEVNEGKNFAPLRQVYSGMVLAAWYKRHLKDSILGQLYVNKAKVDGVRQDDPGENVRIFDEYVAAFRKGVVDMIREDVDEVTQEVVSRRYFSGGASGYVQPAMIQEEDTLTPPQAEQVRKEGAGVDLVPTHLAGSGLPAGSRAPAVSDAPDDDYVSMPEQDKIVAVFFLKFAGRAAGLRFSKDDLQKISEYSRVPFRLREDQQALWVPRLIAEAFLRGLPQSPREVWVAPEKNPLLAAERELHETLRRFFPDASEQDLLEARKRISIKVTARGKLWREAFHKGRPWDISYFTGSLKIDEDRKFAPRIERLRSQWPGHLSRIVVPRDFSIKEFKREDHPIREQIRAALARGDAMEFDISALASREDRYAALTALFPGIGATCQGTMSPDSHAVTDAAFVMDELVSTAFLDGNKMDFSAPLFVVFKAMPDNREVYEVRVFDVGNPAALDLEELELAKKAALTGKGQGLAGWRYERNTAIVAGKVSGTMALAYPLSSAGMDMANAAQVQTDSLGGIDMNAANLDLLIRRDGEGVALPVGEQDLERIPIQGLTPVILDILPAAAMPLFTAEPGTL